MDIFRRFGRFCYDRRMELKLTLREFCRQAGFDASYWSKIERGKAAIPWSMIDQAARGLKVTRGANAKAFRDLAFLSRGEVPDDIMSDKELASLLPLFFCGVRDPEKLKALTECLRK